MEKLQEILNNPIFYIFITVFLGIIQAIPDRIIKAKPITFIGKQIGKFFNGCDIEKELKKINKKIDMNDIENVSNRLNGYFMLLQQRGYLLDHEYDGAFIDIGKWEYYHEVDKHLNGRLKIVIKAIKDSYEKYYGKDKPKK